MAQQQKFSPSKNLGYTVHRTLRYVDQYLIYVMSNPAYIDHQSDIVQLLYMHLESLKIRLINNN